MPYNLNKTRVLLIGAGPMAIDYAKVLSNQEVKYDVVGRGENSAQAFFEKTGKMPIIGGLESFVNANDPTIYSHAIIATGIENLAENSMFLIKAGIKRMLVEKPGGLNVGEIKKLNQTAQNANAEIFIAYNRRFYSSTQKAKEIIEADGGATSFNFEFTEWAHKIEPLDKAPGVKENWLLANSTHLIDLAFYLGGSPIQMKCFTGGKNNLTWHPYSIYSGAGITENGALFSYQANWESAGRWGLEICTINRRIILRPLENLFYIEKGTISMQEILIDNDFDIIFKPGIYAQVKEFLQHPDSIRLITLAKHAENVEQIFSNISGEADFEKNIN